jgi:hypothetical protein
MINKSGHVKWRTVDAAVEHTIRYAIFPLRFFNTFPKFPPDYGKKHYQLIVGYIAFTLLILALKQE